MQAKQDEIRYRLEMCKKQGTLLPVLVDVEYLLDVLQQVQDENKRLEQRREIMQKEYSRIHKQMCEFGQEGDDLEIKLKQSQGRERVLRDALTKIARRESCFNSLSERRETVYTSTGQIAKDALEIK